jgi:signal transduction histidine kinase
VEVEMTGRILIPGNASILLSVFRNLTANAIAYSGGQHIHIAATEESPYVRFLFEDDGTGLGLAIVKHAVLFHGGTIRVENRKPSGLAFTFTLSKR